MHPPPDRTTDMVLRRLSLGGGRIQVAVLRLSGERGQHEPYLVLRTMLGHLLGCAPDEVPLAQRPGRPTLDASAAHADVDMSISRSGVVGLVAVARGHRIGVDVERVGAEDLATAFDERWLSRHERDAIALLPATDRPRALTRAWVQKEAVAKATGVGLWGDLSTYITPLGDRGRIGRWRLSPINTGSGYLGCIAHRAMTLRAHVRTLTSQGEDTL